LNSLAGAKIRSHGAIVNLDQYNQYMPMTDWIDAREAQARLGVRPQTLYAYVSRGRLAVRPDPEDPRRSLYRAGEVDALARRKGRSRKAADVAVQAIAWGEPVLTSAITTIAGGRLYYRGRDAEALAETSSLEAVARLLRGGHGAALKAAGRAPPPTGDTVRARAFAALAARAGAEPPARGRNPLTLSVQAGETMDALTDAVAGRLGEGPIHARLAGAWGHSPDSEGADLIRRALVLLADHELNASTFAARVAASTGASLAASALAGLAALTGPRHGGASAAVRTLAADAAARGPAEAVEAWLLEDRVLPGFGHPLYPEGDPRGRHLMARFEVPPGLEALRGAAVEATGRLPNIDFALVGMAERLRLPDEAPFALFAVARCAGWIAHAVEQGQSPSLIRPRARYVGPAPE
jgi:citrate synthase